jgi:hypothetical protein
MTGHKPQSEKNTPNPELTQFMASILLPNKYRVYILNYLDSTWIRTEEEYNVLQV